MAVWPGRLEVLGGRTTGGRYLATVATYDARADAWASDRVPPMPQARRYFAAMAT